MFTGEGEIAQLLKITDVLGTPDEQEWPDLVNLPNYSKVCACFALTLGMLCGVVTYAIKQMHA